MPELLVLATALEIPPALLLFPDFPGERGGVFGWTVELLPDDRQASPYEAVKWLSGERTLPARRADRERGIHEAPSNLGTQLFAAVRERDRLSRDKLMADMRAAGGDQQYRQLARDLDTELDTATAQIADLRERLALDDDSVAGSA